MKGKYFNWFKYRHCHLLQGEFNLPSHLMDKEMPLLGEMEQDRQTLVTLE